MYSIGVRQPVASFILAFAVFAAFADAEEFAYEPLVGKWSGSVEKNQRDRKQGGNPSEGEVGTPVTIQFARTHEGLEGSSRLGKFTETWAIRSDEYRWSDDRIEVRARRVAFDEIPAWIKNELSLSPTDKVFAFRFSSCKVLKTGKACESKLHFPEGMDRTAHWVFKVDANQLWSQVAYEYADRQHRVLVESLKKE